MHLFMPDRSTHLNVKKMEGIFAHSDQYSHFTRHATNVLHRTEAVHMENHSLSQRGEVAALAARVAALEAQLAM